MRPALIEFRCPHDGKLIFKVSEVADIEVEAKCPRCGELTKARLETAVSESNEE